MGHTRSFEAIKDFHPRRSISERLKNAVIALQRHVLILSIRVAEVWIISLILICLSHGGLDAINLSLAWRKLRSPI